MNHYLCLAGLLLILLLNLTACAEATATSKPLDTLSYEIVVGETVTDNTPVKQLRVDCPAGKVALGAGWSVLDPTDAILDGQVSYFEPAFDGSHWLTNAQNRSEFALEWKLRVRLICAKISN